MKTPPPPYPGAAGDAAGSRRADSELAALEASLLADIESFDLDRALAAANAGTARRDGKDPTAQEFPDILAEGAQLPAQSAKPGLGSNRPAEEKVIQPPSGGLLDALRQQVAQRQDMAQRHGRNQGLAAEMIDQGLRQLFKYQLDLVQHLNELHPPVSREYHLLSQLEFKQLTWKNGFTDYRSQPLGGSTALSAVFLNYTLTGPGIQRLSREGPGVETLRQNLNQYGLNFKCEEFRNERYLVERASFHIANEIRVTARWEADYVNGEVRLSTRNMTRLGDFEFLVPPDMLDITLFEEFGRMLLGQPNRFPSMLRRR
ncbi:MAG: hypothetical protein RIR00_1670 [Pseudomonadota bacterium]|jgi:hypothetical protein